MARHVTAVLTAIVALAVNVGTRAQPSRTVEPVEPGSIVPALPEGTLVLPLEIDMAAAQTFIRIGFGLDETVRFQSTEMLTPRIRTVQAQQLIRMVESYNNFDGTRVADALTEFRGQVSGVQFGREGSPVIYIDLPYWTHQREETVNRSGGERIPESEIMNLIERLRVVMLGELDADEFSVEDHRVRIWWD